MKAVNQVIGREALAARLRGAAVLMAESFVNTFTRADESLPSVLDTL